VNPVPSIRRILVIALSGIGDTLIATPLIHELRLQFPEAEIDALVLWPGSRQILEGNPHLNAVHQHDFLRRSKRATLGFLVSLRRRKYDLSLNVHTLGRREYRYVARAIGARRRLSHSYENQGWFDRWLVTDQIPQDYSVHSVVNNNRLLGVLGIEPQLPSHSYELHLSADEEAFAAQFIEAESLEGQRLLGVHVGSGGTKNLALRRWPLDHYQELFREVHRRAPGLRILLFGGPEEQAVHEQLVRAIPHGLSLPRTPTLRKAAALVKRCDAFISVDTVFMHLAAAVRVPRQLVIETPTVNPPILPLRDDWTLIPNPGVGGRNLDYYRYDGRPIAGSRDQIEALMRSVTVSMVLEPLMKSLESDTKAASTASRRAP